MIELSLLGLHAVRGPDGLELGSLPAQPKRFALLAYLALGGDGYHRRDSLAALFWPELDQFAARRALRNTLFHLRRALGEGPIIIRGGEAVAIDPAELTSDVARLRSAVQEGRYEEAVELCRGELLAGFHLPSAGQAFEEWLSRERLRAADLVTRALGALVEREEGAGNLPVAAYWARRACEQDPSDERWLRRAMSLLDESGDTGAALRLYESCARSLSAEYDTTPSAETAALAKRVRERAGESLVRPNALAADSPAPAATRAVAPPEPAPASGPDPEAARIPPSVEAAPATQRAPATQPPRARRARRVAIGAVLFSAAVLLAVVTVRTAAARHPPTAASRARVLVQVFDNRTGDASLQSLGRMTQDWLAQGILRTDLVDVVDPRAVFVQGQAGAGAPRGPIGLAHRTGAAIVVSGSYYRAKDTLFFQATVEDVRTGRVVRAVGPVRSSVRTPVAALDELRSRVMSALAETVDAHAAPDPGPSEVPPFYAYRDYVDAWDAFWHGDSPRAKGLFLRAARRDTSFVAADLGAAMAAADLNDCAVVDSLTGALTAKPESLDRVGEVSLRMWVARCHGRNDEMLRLALERADLEPRNASAQMSAVAAAMWANRPQRALELLARLDPSVDLAWSADTTHFAYWGGVTEALHLLGRYRAELAAADHLPPGAPLARVWLRGEALAALSQPTAALALLDSALALPVETTSDLGLAPFTYGRPQYTVTPAYVANWISRELAFHGDTVASRQAAMRALAWYRSRPPEERATYEERLVAAWSLEMLGALAEAESITRQLVAEDSSNVDFRGELAGLAAERGDTALADGLDRWLAAQPVARVSWSASVYRARLAALLGRPDSAVARIRDAFDDGLWPAWVHQEPAFARLRTRPDFVALTRPKG